MHPSSDSPGPSRHGKRSIIQPFTSSSSSSEGRRNAAASVEEKDESMAARLECCVCGRRFGTLKALFGHMRCHPEREWRGVRPLTEGEEGSRGRRIWRPRTREDSALAAAAGEYACGECARVFKTRQALGGHRASHRGVMGCGAKAKETTMGVGAAADVRGGGGGGGEDGRTFSCQVCGRQFATYHGMRVHQRVHRERPGGGVEGRKEEKGFMVELNLPPPPVVAEKEDKQVG